ncbi:hypothetical protein V8C86DRAFT_786570 [Haematococcus lacustris]
MHAGSAGVVFFFFFVSISVSGAFSGVNQGVVRVADGSMGGRVTLLLHDVMSGLEAAARTPAGRAAGSDHGDELVGRGC